jgi:hypothetical protein
MNTAITADKASEIIEAVVAKGDIGQLTPQERAKYYVRVCESIGLNPMTRPFEYITLNGKLTLYARKDATDQLRKIYGVSVTDLTERERDGVLTIIAKVTDRDGRTDMATGAVHIKGLQGENLANAYMRAETKSKRRATLSICGLGFLDESELPAVAPGSALPPQTRPRLADQLDALAPSNSGNAPAEKPKRGRTLKKPDELDAVLDEDDPPLTADYPQLQAEIDEGVPDGWPGPEISDYARGKADATAGHVACLNRDIRDDAERLKEWQRGYDSAKRKRP